MALEYGTLPQHLILFVPFISFADPLPQTASIFLSPSFGIYNIDLRVYHSDDLTTMTMVMENQNRPYGGMGFDNVYHNQPQFTDPWAAHTSSHSTPPVYATSMGNGGSMPIGVKQEEVNRTGMSMPYPNIPVSAPTMVAGSTYAPSYGPEVMGMQHEVPRTTFDQAPSYTTAPPMSSFAPASYAPVSYAPIHPSPTDTRRISHT